MSLVTLIVGITMIKINTENAGNGHQIRQRVMKDTE